MEEEFVIETRACKMLGISKYTMRQYAVDGKIPYKLVHGGSIGTRMYAVKDLERFQELKRK